jgi:hypothetical protein
MTAEVSVKPNILNNLPEMMFEINKHATKETPIIKNIGVIFGLLLIVSPSKTLK